MESDWLRQYFKEGNSLRRSYRALGKVQSLRDLAPRHKSVVLSRRLFCACLANFQAFSLGFKMNLSWDPYYWTFVKLNTTNTLWFDFHYTIFGPQRYKYIVVIHEDWFFSLNFFKSLKTALYFRLYNIFKPFVKSFL